MVVPKEPGFYLADGSPCKFADSKQITVEKYVLQHDLTYRAKDGSFYTVRAGFIHDGASKGFLKHFGKYTNAAILHDALYGIKYKRSISDKLFDEAMEVSGVGWFRRNLYWSIVRMAGWSAFNAKTKETVDKNKQYLMIWSK